MTAELPFADRYGPWAVIAGASDGVGAEYARAMAQRGINVVLVARRQQLLDEVAAEIHAATGVEMRTLAVDLATDDAAAAVAAATADLEVGMLMYCAGADPNFEPFLAQPVETAVALVQRNCIVSMQLCHHYVAPMVQRGRGGIVVVSSGAGLAGGRNVVAYGASKAFDMVLAEGLWAEFHDQGVDVLALVLGPTSTPALRRLLVSRGALSGADDDEPIPGAATPAEVVAEAIEHLTDGPTRFAGEQIRLAVDQIRALSRNDAVKLLIERSGGSVMAAKK